MSKAYLILENGAVFEGRQFGYDAEVVGEIVFTTAMTGYLETLSNRSYYGQIVLQTFPLVGNYGIIPEEFGSGPVGLKAYIVREWCQEPSNFRNEGNLDFFLRENMIPGLYGVDTRALTRIIRDCGVMNAIISKSAKPDKETLAKLREYKIAGALETVCTQEAFLANQAVINAMYGNTSTVKSDADAGKAAASGECVSSAKEGPSVALWDFGDATRIAARLVMLGCVVKLVRYDATMEEIVGLRTDGVLLSGGPGDPKENTVVIAQIKKLCDARIPILGIGLGHQMLALASGAKTEKLRFGHHGANQSVKEVKTGRLLVTLQNHGYAVLQASLPTSVKESFINANDGTCEGLDYEIIPALSVQFEPTDEIIERFFSMMKGGSANA